MNNEDFQIVTLLGRCFDGLVFWVAYPNGTYPVNIKILRTSRFFRRLKKANIGDRFKAKVSHDRTEILKVIGPAPIPAA